MSGFSVRRFALVFGAAAALCVGAVACGSSSSGGGGGSGADSSPGVSDSSVTLGVIYDATGPTASTQTPGFNGFSAYMKKVNSEGGIAGREIKIQSCDEKYTPEAGLQCLKRFTTQEPVFALGDSLNGGDFQVSADPVVQRAQIPVVGPQAVESEVLEAGDPYIFFAQCDYANMADVAVPYADQLTGVEKPKVATVVLPVPGGVDWSNLIKENVTEVGGEYTATHELDPSATQADAIAQQLANEEPDWIGFHGGVANAVVLLKSMAKFDVDIPVIGISQIGVHETWESSPESAGKNFASIGCFSSSDVETEGTAELLSVAKAAGEESEASNVAFVQGYVTAKIMAAAMEEAGEELTRGSFMEALEGMGEFSTEGLSAPVKYSPESRMGITVTRPYTFDYAKKTIVADGDYSEWEKYVNQGPGFVSGGGESGD